MDLILQDFQDDLAKVKKILAFLQEIRSFRATAKPDSPVDPFAAQACGLHDGINGCHADLVMLSGALVLYLGGRFEYFVRERFEQACDIIANKCNRFADMPKVMREQLIQLTAAVMSEPRKYGHGDKGVESFIKNLAANMAANNGVTNINRQCLSITYENMRPPTLRTLFERIAAKDIWQSIAEQACMRTHLGTSSVPEAKSAAMKYLNNFMDLRNQIAHPSTNFSWPDVSKVEEYIAFFEVLGRAISDVVELHETTLQIAATAVPSDPMVDTEQFVDAIDDVQDQAADLATSRNSNGETTPTEDGKQPFPD
ncbi:MAG: HEPN domain-containing protein [bacterium]|nr:HEPN domain-containing protein [bacterium]